MVSFLFNTFSHLEAILLLWLTGYLIYARLLAWNYFSLVFFGISHSVVDLEAVLQMLYCRYYIVPHYPLEVSALKGIVLFKSIVE